MSASAHPRVVISGSGLWTPDHIITNDELVSAYNEWAKRYNDQHASAIAAGEREAKPLSSVEFIEKASGIKQRYAYIKDGILDVDRMRPVIPERPDEAVSDQAEMAVQHLTDHISRHGLNVPNIRRWWLHQANINMNLHIGGKLLGHEATFDEAPIVLDRYANTASAGSLIAFHLYHQDLKPGDHGVICSFGAGY
jgi:beta-ketodecanoyl-[acyl-carrier-protein] synthase